MKRNNYVLCIDTKRPRIKCPITKHPRFQNVQSYKTSKLTKCPNLQNIQSYKMSKDKKCPKLQHVQSYNMSKVTTCPKLQNVQPWTFFNFGHFVNLGFLLSWVFCFLSVLFLGVLYPLPVCYCFISGLYSWIPVKKTQMLNKLLLSY